MKRIFKYKIERSNYELQLPIDAEILSAGVQGGDVVVWALVEEHAETEKRTLRVVETGGEAPYGGMPYGQIDIEFINTVFMGGLVFHIFIDTV